MFMSKDKSEQRGTLLIEAIAMLGLIAMVTPTLYKKSAERLQEIQDINIASQARMMNGIIETFINNHKTEFIEREGEYAFYELFREKGHSSTANIKTISDGYSSVIPAGFRPNDVKYFGDPRVFVISDARTHTIAYYIVYPKITDIGQRRTARLASLIGSNGGFLKEASSVTGVGSSWVINEELIKNYNLPSEFTDLLDGDHINTLVMTNSETISTKQNEDDKYLYRIPDTGGNYIHNTMVSNLYLGGNPNEENTWSNDYYSIFNVRKLSLNTRCSANPIENPPAAGDENCREFRETNTADLYIGKPEGKFLDIPTNGTGGDGTQKNYQANTGAAWIYGNLSALENRFKLFNTDGASVDRNGYDVMEFSRLVADAENPDNIVVGTEVLKATNDSANAQVRFINGHVRAIENGTYGSTHASTNGPAFYVGGNVDSTEVEGRQIAAFQAGDKDVVMINDVASNNTETYINRQGGVVHINGSSGVAGAGSTFVNEEGGYLIAGKDGRWLRAEGTGNAKVMMLYDSDNKVPAHGSFSVAGGAVDSSAVWANSQMVSLYGGAIRAYQGTRNFKDKNIGGSAAIAQYEQGLDNEAKLGSTLTGGAVLAAKYTDILGDTYVGAKEMSSKIDDSLPFDRGDWKLGVAGSAWVDEMLFANEAWFNSSGFRELHAGFSSYGDFQQNPRRGWLNAYSTGVSIGNRDNAESTGVGGIHAPDTRFLADKDQVYLGDSSGSMAYMKEGLAQFGYAEDVSKVISNRKNFTNYVGADSSGALVVGEKLAKIYTENSTGTDTAVVNLQKGALLLKGHSMNSSESQHNYSANIVEAHASDFEVYTKDVTASAASSKAQFRVNGDSAVVQHIDFAVRASTSSDVDKARFLVQPDEDSINGAPHVTVDGSFHVTGNKVIHVASNENNVADKDGSHAMFEIDPTAIKVMAMKQVKDDVYDIDSSRSMILKINPMDINGARIENSSAIVGGGENQASIYIRKGAIELMHNTESSWAADQGFGYIKADRLVVDSSIVAPYWDDGDDSKPKYDQYMVNPAYTSVMHDIKLTTRGGARLSDILPDYILKGVYIVANDFAEKRRYRVAWSAGGENGYYCKNYSKILGAVKCEDVDVVWADPYVGVVPFAPCPRGYKNMATITPTSFQMAQAGDILQSNDGSLAENKTAKRITPTGKYVVNPKPRYMDILNTANGEQLVVPVYNEVKTLVARHSVNAAGIDEPYQSSKTAGWFLGFNAEYKDDGTPDGDLVSDLDSSNVWALKFIKNNTTANYIAEPLYFQQNTFLKTALQLGDGVIKDKGWNAYMGFLYDLGNTGYDVNRLGRGLGDFKEQTNTDNKDDTIENKQDFVWNLFPVPTNSIEGYAHVYCYFDRKEFLGEDLKGDSKWKNVIDPVDMLNVDWHKDGGRNKNSNQEYKNRLNDPKLKYKDPW